jgi:hypothetical protein
VYTGEDVGITEIDGVIGKFKRAAIDDGKGRGDRPPT